MVVIAPHHFGERLKRAMDDCAGGKVTIPEIAEICEVSYQAVKKWLDSPEPKLGAVPAMKVAKRLGVNVAWLILGDGPMLPSQKPELDLYWPFEDVDRLRYESLSATKKGAVQKAMRDEIEKVEQIGLPATNRANDIAA